MKTSLTLGNVALVISVLWAANVDRAFAADSRAAQVVRSGNPSALAAVITIVEPVRGSAVARADLRIRVTHGAAYNGQQLAEVELTLQSTGHAMGPGNWGPYGPPSDLGFGASSDVITWQVPLDRLAQGWVPPRDARIDAWNGLASLQIRVKDAQGLALSDPIPFTLGSNAERQATTLSPPAGRVASADPRATNVAVPGTGAQNPGTLARQRPNSSGVISTAPPLATPSAMTVTNQANRYASPMEIVEPAPGSTLTQGNLRVHVRPPTGAAATQMAEVELSWLPPRTNKPGEAMPAPPAVKVKTWQVRLDRLIQGVVLPRDVTDAWIGPTLVRVRMAGTGESAWSNGVSFNLVSVGGRQATTPATAPNWMATMPAPAAKATPPGANPSIGKANPVGAAAATGAPASSLQSRP